VFKRRGVLVAGGGYDIFIIPEVFGQEGHESGIGWQCVEEQLSVVQQGIRGVSECIGEEVQYFVYT
jgi:hypothetical protein